MLRYVKYCISYSLGIIIFVSKSVQICVDEESLVCIYIYGTLFFEIIHQYYFLHLFYMVSEPNTDILYNIGRGASLFEYF